MDRAGKKGRVFVFIFFTSKWTKIKDPNEIKKRINRVFFSTFTNAWLLNSNYSKLLFKVTFLSQVINANKSDLSKWKSIASSNANLDFDKKASLFNLIMHTDQDQL